MELRFLLVIAIVCVGCTLGLNTKKTLIISFDGFRADKLDSFIRDNPDSNFKYVVDNGLKADYMTPIFPSSTSANHWTLVTGVHAETHGIVGNTIYDPKYNKIVKFTSSSDANEPQWWNKTEPVWFTAKKNGLKTASSFWIGSAVWPINPDIWLPFTNSYTFESRIDELINWYIKFNIDFAAFYFPEPDATGHTYGPDSQNYADMIKNMDRMLGLILKGLRDFSILDKLNVVIVSDHGMAQGIGKPVLLQNYVDLNLMDRNKSIISYVSNIFLKSPDQLTNLYEALSKLPNTTVYYKKDVPPQYKYQNNDRIGDIVTVSDEGSTLTNDPNYSGVLGIHGYNNSLVSMRAIFMAMGPNFKKAQTMNGFANVHVQPLVCKLLDIKCDQSAETAAIFEPFMNASNRLFAVYNISVLNIFLIISIYFLTI